MNLEFPTGTAASAVVQLEAYLPANSLQYYLYRASHVLVDLGWVDLDFCVLPSCPAAQPLLPNSHQPKQSWADGGTLKIQVNKTQSTSTCPWTSCTWMCTVYYYDEDNLRFRILYWIFSILCSNAIKCIKDIAVAQFKDDIHRNKEGERRNDLAILGNFVIQLHRRVAGGRFIKPAICLTMRSQGELGADYISIRWPAAAAAKKSGHGGDEVGSKVDFCSTWVKSSQVKLELNRTDSRFSTH